MRTNLIIILFACITSIVNGQSSVNEKKMVGFGCYYAGQPTKPVIKVTNLLNERRYRLVSNLLKSGNGAEKFLAVVSLEKLSAMELYQLTESEKELIERIKISSDKVSVCSGCTYFDKVSLKDMFSKDNFLGSGWWIEKTLKNE